MLTPKLFVSLDEDSVHISHIFVNLLITGKMQEVLLKTHDKFTYIYVSQMFKKTLTLMLEVKILE
jgi:hypothetical protein